jgi:hypothetical protein
MLISQRGTFEWETPMSTETCSFSLQHYREILQTAKTAGYEFLLFDEAQTSTADRCCLLRHDIDYTPEKAMEFGKIEADCGIRSTFFFQVVAWTYNARERTCYRTIRELADMGHQIGLHFDVTWQAQTGWEDLLDLCARERELLSHMTGLNIPDIISFHNPGTYAVKVINKDVVGIHHTYEPRYFSEFKYLSDSQGWYEGCVCKIFESGKYPNIQLLTHPYIWWEVPRSDFIEDMAAFINMRRDELTQYMIAHHPVCAKHEDRLRKLVENAS